MKKSLIIVLLTLASKSVTASEAISVKKVASGKFELTLTSDSALEPRSAQAKLIPTAQSLCGDMYPQFGRYKFESTDVIEQSPASDNLANFRMVQQVLCVGTAPADEAGTRESFIFDPEEERALIERILSLSQSYFVDIFSGNYEKAYGLLSARMQQFRSFEEWVALMDQVRADSGPISTLSIHNITIYDNPPNAPEPGLYVAADYQNSFEKAPYHCGYLLWFRGQAGEFKITREETGLVTHTVFDEIPKEKRVEFLDEMRCTARQQ